MKKLLLAALLVPSVGVFAQQRVPLFENFSSSTCGPCKNGNAVYKSVVDSKPATEYVSVKYQQDFPTAGGGTIKGDPYATSETINRRNYYSINSIPRMEANGGWDKNAGQFTSTDYTTFKNQPATYNLSGAYTLDASTKEVKAKVTYAPLNNTVAAAGVRLHIVIIESVTENNAKTNGETKFYDIVKKMLPNNQGTGLGAMTVGTPQTTTLTYKFEGVYRLPSDGASANRINLGTEHSVENFANLKVVAWVQGADKTVYQAAHLMKVNSLDVNDVTNNLDSYTLYPNPASNVINIDVTMKNADDVSAMLVNLNGAVVAQKSMSLKAGNNKMSMDVQNLPAGYYTMIISDSKTNAFVEKVTIVH